MTTQFQLQIPNMPGKPKLDLSAMTGQLLKVAAAWRTARPVLSLYTGTPRSGMPFAKWVPMNQMPEGAGGYHDTYRGQPRLVLGYMSVNDPTWNNDVAFHEAAEALVDPNGIRFITGPSLRDRNKHVQYLAEVCDPCENVLYAFVSPAFYQAPHLNPTGYISWIEDNHWWQAFADDHGAISYENLGLAAKRTRKEKERLRIEAGLPG